MDKKQYSAVIEIQGGELQEIMQELNDALKVVYRCYDRLENLGVVVIREAVSGN